MLKVLLVVASTICWTCYALQEPEWAVPSHEDDAKAPMVAEKVGQWYSSDENNGPVDEASLDGQLSAQKRANRLAKMDPSWRHIGLGKRDTDPTWSMVGLGKKRANADPTWGMVGLGKRAGSPDPTWSMVGLGKRSGSPDPTWSMVGLGKRSADPTWGMVGLGKRAHSLLQGDNAVDAEWPLLNTNRRR
uniref:Uncharacterized protein n=1 Tax=Plectus sambesii TaxID=2011161 RepID=A0A914V0Q3_9BILA